VTCEKFDFTDEYFVDTKSEHHNCEFTGMEKYTNYSCRLRAYNNFGNGTWSKQLVISTDEDGMWKIRSVCLLLGKKTIHTKKPMDRNGSVSGLRKQPTSGDAITQFPHQMTSEKRAQKFHTDDVSLLRSSSASDCIVEENF